MRFNMALFDRIHITGEQFYPRSFHTTSSIDSHRNGVWDFTHLEGTVTQLLEQNGSSNVFLYAGVEGITGRADQVPFVVALVSPQGNIPTSTVMKYNKNTTETELLPFDHDLVQFRWDRIRRRPFEGRLYILVCDLDASKIPTANGAWEKKIRKDKDEDRTFEAGDEVLAHDPATGNVFPGFVVQVKLAAPPTQEARQPPSDQRETEMAVPTQNSAKPPTLSDVPTIRMTRSKTKERLITQPLVVDHYKIQRHDGQMFTLDPTNVFEEGKAYIEVQDPEYYFLEQCTPYTLHLSDMERKDDGRLKVKELTYSFRDQFDEDQIDTFDASQQTVRQHINKVIEVDFEGDASQYDYIKSQMLRGAEEQRNLMEDRIREFFEDKDADFSQRMKVFKICPLNAPDATVPTLPGCYDKFRKEIQVVDHSQSLARGGCPLYSLKSRFDCSAAVESRLGKLCQALLVDLLENTGRLPLLVTGDLLLPLTDGSSGTFRPNRILQHMDALSAFSHFNNEQPFIISITAAAASKAKRQGRAPGSLRDFMVNFLFDGEDSSELPEGRIAVTLQLHGEQLQIRLGDKSTTNGEVGEITTSLPISATGLAELVPPDDFVPLIINLLAQGEDNSIHMPAGARVPVPTTTENACVKEALLNTPEYMLSPQGKERVMTTFPDRGIPYEELQLLLGKHVKTVSIRKEKKNLKKVAMESSNVMIGQFQSGPRLHSVLIDGASGTITDPVEAYGTVDRTDGCFEKLGITDFTSLIILNRTELSDKRRETLQKDTGLPWLPEEL